MIATTKEITDKAKLMEYKQKIEEKLKDLGENWGYVQKTTQLDAPVLQRFIDLKGISEDDLTLILKAVNVSVEKEQPQITPNVEKTEKTTQKVEKWSYEKFRNMVLEELREKDFITSSDVKQLTGKPMPFWKHHIERMKKEQAIEEFSVPNLGRGPKQIRAYRLPTMTDNTAKATEDQSEKPQVVRKNQLIEITLSNGETFKIEADEVEFTDPVLIRRKGKIVMAIDPEMFECVSRGGCK